MSKTEDWSCSCHCHSSPQGSASILLFRSRAVPTSEPTFSSSSKWLCSVRSHTKKSNLAIKSDASHSLDTERGCEEPSKSGDLVAQIQFHQLIYSHRLSPRRGSEPATYTPAAFGPFKARDSSHIPPWWSRFPHCMWEICRALTCRTCLHEKWASNKSQLSN